jgi:hypothetical protein
MEETIRELQSIVITYGGQLNGLTEEQWSYKPNPAKWSRKEILGHLIDSAQNNIRRFVVAQYADSPKIVYAQDMWVGAADYQNYVTTDLITLWTLLNKHICTVLNNLSEGAKDRICDVGELRSIEYLAADYNKHLLHHLHQLLDLEPIAYP